jgi:peptidyl-prolyl cis-trans isomerase D
MFDFVRNNKRLMQGVLALLILPSLVLVGADSYQNRDAANAVATVAGQKISQQEWDNAQREAMDRYRQMLGERFDPKMFDSPQIKRDILEGLLAKKALEAEVVKNHMAYSDQQLMDFYAQNFPAGEAGKLQYQAAAAQRGMTTQGLDAFVRQQQVINQLNSAIGGTAFAPRSVSERLSTLNEQEREAQEMVFSAAQYAPQVKVTDEMVKAFYDKNGELFMVPEQAKIEYVVLDSAAVESQVSVTDAEIADFYEKNKQRFGSEEQRTASHILLAAGKEASAAEKAAAKAKAESLLAQLRKEPGKFAELAKAHSQDPVSGEAGGDLGVMTKGLFVKPVEDAINSLKQGEISNLVESEFGYHIITVTRIVPAQQRALADVKEEVTKEVKTQKMGKKWSEMAEVFGDTVYEQADSLKPVADKLKLQIQTADGVVRNPSPQMAGAAFNNPKFLNALFGDALKNKRNTEAVEVAPSTLMAGRVVEHKPATKRPLAEVQEAIRMRVTQEEAVKLAKKEGEAKLAAVKASGDATGFGEAKVVARLQQPPFAPAAAEAIMKADTAKLPAYVGVELPGQGYALYRINKVSQATPDAARRKQEQEQIAGAVGQTEMYAYVEAIKKKGKAKINTTIGEAK